jgi:glycosyltransferase involved in cell wall biosynthesis
VEGSSPLELAIFSITGFLKAAQFHRKNPFDGCLAFHATASGWISWALKKQCNIPYILLLRGADVPGFVPEMYSRLHRIARPLTSATWKNARGILANSPGLMDLANRTASALNLKIGMIPNGVDTLFFHPPAVYPDSKILQAIFVGRLTEQKGLIYLLDGLESKVAELKDKIHLEIIGEGPLKPSLMEYVEQHGLNPVVSFSSWMDKKLLLEKYQSSHIFVFPSIEEGMPNAVLEAMACGLPVLGTDIYGHTGLIENNVTGFLASPRQSAIIGQLLVQITGMERSQLAVMGREGRRRAEQRSWSQAAQACLAALFPETPLS